MVQGDNAYVLLEHHVSADRRAAYVSVLNLSMVICQVQTKPPVARGGRGCMQCACSSMLMCLFVVVITQVITSLGAALVFSFISSLTTVFVGASLLGLTLTCSTMVWDIVLHARRARRLREHKASKARKAVKVAPN